MLTDNRVLVDNIRELPAIMCAQKKASKCVPTEEDMIQANINSFGDEIGKITNRVTSMYDKISEFEPESDEYKVLEYRIRCGQLQQQNAIDKAKGIISEPMPKHWYDWHSIVGEDEESMFNRRIVADKKPYFMKYIYPNLMNDYNDHVKTLSRKCSLMYGITLDELLSMSSELLTDSQRDFVKYYNVYLPVSNGNCVMNRICHRIEDEFDRYLSKNPPAKSFDKELLKKGSSYTYPVRRKVEDLYTEFVKRSKEYMQTASKKRLSAEARYSQKLVINREFRERTQEVCSNADDLADIIIDVCYKKDWSKQFAWDTVGDIMIKNLLEKNGYQLSYPTLDPDGEITYGGNKFTVKTKDVRGYYDEYYFE